MALITIQSVIALAPSVYRFVWSDAGGGPWYVYLRGRLFGQVGVARFDAYELDPAVVPMVEVATSADDLPLMLAHPEYHVVQWFHDPAVDVALFLVEQWTGSSWDGIDLVASNPGSYIGFESPRLAHNAASRHRVTAVLADGTSQVAVESQVHVVRVPDVPRVAYVYDAGAGEVTVEAA